MRIGSLFSGAAGLDRAVEAVFGAEVAWFAEIDKAASKVLAYHYPNVPNLGSVTDIDWATVPPVDIICGGFPCTDVSAAGKRAGMHGTRSGLWSHMAEAIDVLRPRYVIVENVRGLLNANANRPLESAEDDLGNGSGGLVLRAIGAVLGDLADIGGYEARWVTLAAASVGAPHRRERVFIFASLAGGAAVGESSRGSLAEEAGTQPGDRSGDHRGERSARDGWQACGCGCRRIDHDWGAHPDRFDDGGCRRCRCEGFWPDTFISRDGDVALLPTPRSSDCFGAGQHGDGGMDLRTTMALLCTPSAADGAGGHLNGSGGRQHEQLLPGQAREMATAWGKYAPAIRRWEQIVGPAPAPTEPNKNGNPRLSAAFSQWLMGWPAGWVTDPAIGISRNDQLRIVGNGVCSQQAVAALRFLLSVETGTAHDHETAAEAI